MNEKETKKVTRKKPDAQTAPKRTYRKKQSAPSVVTAEADAPVQKTRTRQPREIRKTPVKIIPLGGLNEIGKNMTLFMCSNDIFILDCGLTFPDADMPGVDIVIPDFTFVERNREKIRGVVITHGHEDHIGGLAYLLKKVNVPVYGTKLTIGLIEGKIEETLLRGQTIGGIAGDAYDDMCNYFFIFTSYSIYSFLQWRKRTRY